jgi:hypothetical protein
VVVVVVVVVSMAGLAAAVVKAEAVNDKPWGRSVCV